MFLSSADFFSTGYGRVDDVIYLTLRVQLCSTIRSKRY
jgi:hypothetical protein